MPSCRCAVPIITSPNVVLPRRRARICTAGYKIHIGREERTGGRPRGRHREVRRACSGGPFSGAWMSVSDRASWGRAVQRTRSPGRRTHREVIVRLQRDDPILDSNSRYHAIVIDDDVRIGWHINPRGPNSSGSGGIGNDTHCTTRMRRADRARVCVLPLRGRRGRVVVAARVHVHVSVVLRLRVWARVGRRSGRRRPRRSIGSSKMESMHTSGRRCRLVPHRAGDDSPAPVPTRDSDGTSGCI